MNAQDTITTHNFIADYTDQTGKHFYRCFQMMDLLIRANEAQAAKNLQEHLENDGLIPYCLMCIRMCIREKLSMEELQYVADSGKLPDTKQGHICLYPGMQCIRDMELSTSHRYRNYAIGQRGFANGQKG